MIQLIWLTVALPLVGFLVNGGLALRRPGAKAAVSLVGPGVVIGAFGVAVAAFLEALRSPLEAAVIVPLWQWLPVGNLQIELAFQVDQLSLVTLLIVTGVGSLIHLFSVGYMKADPGYARYFAYLNLFVAFMLILVLGANFPVLFMSVLWKDCTTRRHNSSGRWRGSSHQASSPYRSLSWRSLSSNSRRYS